MTQILVDLIVRYWNVMPRRLKVWAFMHDGDKANIAYCILYILVVLSVVCMGIGLVLLWRVGK